MSTEKELKKKVYWKTSFMVFLYAGILFACFALQTILYLGESFHWKGFEYLNTNFELPIDNLTLLWLVICATYIGVDRAAYCVKSAEMISGKSDVGDPNTLRVVIALSIFFFILAVVCNIFSDANYDLTTLSTSVGMNISLYIGGQKAITLCKNVNGKQE